MNLVGPECPMFRRTRRPYRMLLLWVLKLCGEGHLVTLVGSWTVSWEGMFPQLWESPPECVLLSPLPQHIPVTSWPQTLNKHLTQNQTCLQKPLCLGSLKCLAYSWLAEVRIYFLYLSLSVLFFK